MKTLFRSLQALLLIAATSLTASERTENEQWLIGNLEAVVSSGEGVMIWDDGTVVTLASDDQLVVAEDTAKDRSIQLQDQIRRQFEAALQALAASEIDAKAISAIAPYVSALIPQLELLEDHLAAALVEKSNLSGIGFIGILLGDPDDAGIPIISVSPNSPASEAGLDEGDLLTSIDGVKIGDADDPKRAALVLINSTKPGTVVKLGVTREGRSVTESVTVGSLPRRAGGRLDNFATVYHPNNSAQVVRIGRQLWPDIRASQKLRGLVLFEFESDLGHYFDMEYGVLVLDAPEGRGLKDGDALLKINGKAVRSISHAQRYFSGSDKVAKVEIQRKGKKHEVELVVNDLIISDAHRAL